MDVSFCTALLGYYGVDPLAEAEREARENAEAKKGEKKKGDKETLIRPLTPKIEVLGAGWDEVCRFLARCVLVDRLEKIAGICVARGSFEVLDKAFEGCAMIIGDALMKSFEVYFSDMTSRLRPAEDLVKLLMTSTHSWPAILNLVQKEKDFRPQQDDADTSILIHRDQAAVIAKGFRRLMTLAIEKVASGIAADGNGRSLGEVNAAWRVLGALGGHMARSLEALKEKTQGYDFKADQEIVEDCLSRINSDLVAKSLKPVEDEVEWEDYWGFVSAVQTGDSRIKRTSAHSTPTSKMVKVKAGSAKRKGKSPPSTPSKKRKVTASAARSKKFAEPKQRKNRKRSNNDEDGEDGDITGPSPSKRPRRSTRSKKSTKEISDDEEDNDAVDAGEDEEEEEIPAKTGRRGKAATTTDQDDEDDMTERVAAALRETAHSPPPLERKRRGRPPKKVAPQDEADQEENVDEGLDEMGVDEPVKATHVPRAAVAKSPAKKGRKKFTPESDEDKENDGGEDAGYVKFTDREEESASTPPPARRGRPKKVVPAISPMVSKLLPPRVTRKATATDEEDENEDDSSRISPQAAKGRATYKRGVAARAVVSSSSESPAPLMKKRLGMRVAASRSASSSSVSAAGSKRTTSSGSVGTDESGISKGRSEEIAEEERDDEDEEAEAEEEIADEEEEDEETANDDGDDDDDDQRSVRSFVIPSRTVKRVRL
ncbi:hypothetical protein BC829DRAFT_393878, partial [Chytridium lagenaria]